MKDRVSNGQCVQCAKPHSTGRQRCQECLDAAKKWKKHYKANGMYKEWKREYQRRKRKNDPVWRVKQAMCNRLRKALKSKGIKKQVSVSKSFGCTNAELKVWIESQFKPGMTWDNYGNGPGKWQVDHNVPLAFFDLTTEKGQREANHWSNLRPMWYEEHQNKTTQRDLPIIRWAKS